MGEISSQEKQVLMVLGLLIVIGMMFYFVTHLPSRQKPDSVSIIDTSNQIETTANNSVGKIYVHLSGAVKKPGVYTLANSTRLYEAIQIAGGALPLADLDSLNLSQALTDGQKVVIKSKAYNIEHTNKVAQGSGEVVGTVLDLNSATIQELDTLPKVGPALAKRIVEYREKQSFSTLEDLRKVKGIGAKMFEAIKPLVTI